MTWLVVLMCYKLGYQLLDLETCNHIMWKVSRIIHAHLHLIFISVVLVNGSMRLLLFIFIIFLRCNVNYFRGNWLDQMKFQAIINQWGKCLLCLFISKLLDDLCTDAEYSILYHLKDYFILLPISPEQSVPKEILDQIDSYPKKENTKTRK